MSTASPRHAPPPPAPTSVTYPIDMYVQHRLRISHLVFVRANERLFVVVREEAVLQSEVARLPLGEVPALLHQVTLTSR